MHNIPAMEVGTFATRKGTITSSENLFEISFEGKGGHAALPHLTIDPIVIASQIVLSLQTIISRVLNPVDKALITITKIHGGSAHNVIDDEVILNGTVRAFKQETRDKIERKINETAEGIAKANGGEAEVVYSRKYPPTINSEKESIFASNVAKELVGEKNVQMDVAPSMGGEDFSYLLNKKPGSYLYIGQKDAEHESYLHTTK